MTELASTVETSGRAGEVAQYSSTDACLSCGASFEGTFCSSCGQKRPQRLGFKRVSKDAIQNVVNLDARFLRTMVELTRRPGQVAKEYVDGRRHVYMSPLKYMFFCTTLYIVLYAVFDIEYFQPERWGSAEGQASFDFVMNLLPYLIFVELLPVAGLQRLLFRKAPYNVAECYVTQLYAFGHAILYTAPLGLMGLGSTALGLLALRLLALPVFAWTLVQFYRDGIISTVLKALLLYVVYLILSVIFGFAASRFFFQFLY